MSDPQVLRPDKDYKEILDGAFPEIEAAAKDDLAGAIEKLAGLEKQTRQASDMNSTGRVLVKVCELCRNAGDYTMLQEQVQLMSKKHGQLKGAITKMVQRCIDFLDDTPSQAVQLELIDCLRNVTEGKIYVEVERARLTRMLSRIKEEAGEQREAQEILTGLQVETFGSMDKREKTEFILEQVRLTLALEDYTLAAILARKISTRSFDKDEDAADLKLRYYELMIRIGLHDDSYLDITRYYHHVLNTPSVLDDPAKWQDILANVVYFVVLSRHDNEQSDLLHRVASDPKLAQLPMHAQLVKCFTTPELMRWPGIEDVYGKHLRGTPVFGDGAGGDGRGGKRYEALRKRVIEHNVRVVAKYYKRVTLNRLQQLLDLSAEACEAELAQLVTDKMVYARIDRPKGIVTFGERQKPEDLLKAWSYDVGKLLDGIEKVRQLIVKENTVHSLPQIA
ncbi:proteasome regulatory particle subunit [Savitreella phatthalungensis]